MASRRWGQWPGGFLAAFRDTSGVVGAAGVMAAAAGAFGAVPLAVGAFGAAAVVGSALWAGAKSFPRLLEHPSTLLGKRVDTSRLGRIDPPPLKIGVIGPTLAGKTTLLDHASLRAPRGERTDNLYAVIVALQTSPQRYVALIDGAGAVYSQQFRVAEHADLLVIIVDHNRSSSEPAVDDERLAAHQEFVNQLIGHLKEQLEQHPSQRPKRIHVLLNKSDLWRGSPGEGQLVKWFRDLTSGLAATGWASQFSSAHHSNRDVASVGDFGRFLSECSKQFHA